MQPEFTDRASMTLPGRGEVIEGQVWTDLQTEVIDIEILKVFHMGSHAGQEHVLALILPRDQPLLNDLPLLTNSVISIPRKQLESQYSLTYGPNTTILREALVHYRNCVPAA